MRLPERPEPGLVLCYAYLWTSESDRGLLEGAKDRPAVVVLARKTVGRSELVYVAPVTHSPPAHSFEKVAIPPAVQERLDLDMKEAWISATELNVFVWPGPDLRPIRRSAAGGADTPCFYGYLPPSLFRDLKRAIGENWAAGHMRAVKR